MSERTRSEIPCPTVYPERETWHSGMSPDQPGIKTYNVPCEGRLYPCPICGQTSYCSREARCLHDEDGAHIVQRRFSIDEMYTEPCAACAGLTDYDPKDRCATCKGSGLVGMKGWTRGARWNGWATPMFEKPEMLRIVGHQAEYGGDDWVMTFDETTQIVTLVNSAYDEPETEIWGAETIETAQGPKTVWAIGAFCWTWDSEDL